MKTRNRVLAIFAASALALGAVGVAFATDLHEQQAGMTLGSFTGTQTECDAWPADAPQIGAGQVGVHFILTGAEADSGNLTADFTSPTTHVGSTASFKSAGGTVHWYIVITGDANTVITGASTDIDGDLLNVSHTCFGAPAPTPTAPGSTPSFSQTEEGATDAATEPSTDTFGGNGTSGPAGGAWLLVVALGVLLASIVVLTPARAKGRR
jgi:hypothetical protein